MPQQNLGLNPFAYIQRPGYEPYIPGAEQSYENLSTLGRVEVLGQKRDRQAALESEAQRKAQAEQILTETVAKFPDRPEEGVLELRRRGLVKEANEWEKHVSEMKKVKIEEAKALLEQKKFDKTVDDETYKREQAMLDATSPAALAKLFANVKDPKAIADMQAYAKWRWGTAAERGLAALPKDPTEMTALAIGPEKFADDARLAQSAADAAANQLRDDTRAGASAAETARHNRAMEGYQAAQEKRLSSQGAGGADGTPKLSAANIEKVAAVDQAMGMIGDIETSLPSMSRSIGAIDGRWLKAKIASGAKVTPGEADFDAQITALKNAVIKATTGAAMSEPEAQRIMGQIPDLTNNETVFKARLAATRRNLELLKKRTIELSGGTVGAVPGKALTAEELIKKYGGG